MPLFKTELDFRAVLGNNTAIKAYRGNKLPSPEGTIVMRIAWSYGASEENNRIFGRASLSFPGSSRVHISVYGQELEKVRGNRRLGYSQFDKDGKPADEVPLKTCFPCQQKGEARDFVFTHYSPQSENQSSSEAK